ncbi:MAG: RNA methyltransferase [Bacteroidales bacterium]|jgi:tRNA (guanosine-2'-O-)-methyltransferase|nr:RNA methyltransferase [Bacteroidales bacterium]
MDNNILYQLRDISPKQQAGLTDYLSEFLLPERNERLREVLNLRTRQLTIVLEDLFQTQNISAVLRTCECYGVQDVYIIEGQNEFRIHDAISMGASKWLTLHNYPYTSSSKVGCIKQLKQKGYKIAATLPAENSYFTDQVPIEEKTAFLFGTELLGLSEEAIALADYSVKIPMYGFTESFNISNSVAILVSHFVEKLRKSSVNWALTEFEKKELLFEWLQKSIKKPHLIIENYLKK